MQLRAHCDSTMWIQTSLLTVIYFAFFWADAPTSIFFFPSFVGRKVRKSKENFPFNPSPLWWCPTGTPFQSPLVISVAGGQCHCQVQKRCCHSRQSKTLCDFFSGVLACSWELCCEPRADSAESAALAPLCSWSCCSQRGAGEGWVP